MIKKILVVDDEIDVLETIVDTIELEFDDTVSVSKAYNGQEALEIFKKDSFDLVVTDLNMPIMDGIEFTSNVKKINHQAPVIVFTGHGDSEEQQRLTNLGVEIMIKKPFVEDLIDEIVGHFRVVCESAQKNS